MLRKPRALSLLETIFCCALLGLFLSVVSQLVVSAYRTQALYRDRLERQRAATVFLKQLTRQLQSARDVRLVSTGDPPAAASDLTGDGLVVTYETANGPRTSLFYRESATSTVNCEQFGASFNPSIPATWVALPGSPKVEARRADALTIEPLTLGTLKMWRVKLTLEGLPQPYVRQIRQMPTEGL